MTKSEFRYAHHPEDVKKYTTQELRDHFLIPELFKKNEINLTYTMYDRYIAGGAFPVDKKISLEPIDDLKADFFLERRELGIINVG
ncbi:5-dehydro-4-deoxy-D-glucuronate isomerase, partial [Gramella sp. AN32]|nr:5-dehydro-4-deoxy-D-glucuronate isomerase [Gramella sp. AN32]